MTTHQVLDGLWALLAVALVVVGALSVLRPGGRGGVAGFGALVRTATAHPVARCTLVLGWMWLGWHLFAR